jgi:hypothetical protein
MTIRKRRSAIQNPKSKIHNRKRGIVLLVVVSLLAMFILMGVAFAIVAMHYKNTAERVPQVERYGDPPQRESELILDQILFGTNGRSSLRYHDLLGDLYGGDSVTGALTIADATNLDTPPGYTGAAGQQPQVWQFTASGSFNSVPGYYAGRVLTFLTGNAAGHSTRILEYAYDPGSGLYGFAVEAIESKGPVLLKPNYNATAALNSTFVINGAPFNGMGAGFNPTTAAMDAMYTGYDYTGAGSTTPNLVALLPHFAGYDPTFGSSVVPLIGGADESWDTPDFQNMALAMVPPAAYTGGVPIIPSYHRPELVNYWMANLPGEFSGGFDAFDPTGINPQQAANVRNFLRTFIFRPMPWDNLDASGNSYFSGSNPAFDLTNIRQQALVNLGSTTEPAFSQEVTRLLLVNLINAGNAPIWDVDNDNDGVPDSIWIDPGLPVVTRPDGRRYKRLVAILIKDLDGRINLNAHGNRAQVTPFGINDNRAEFQVPAGFGMVGAGGAGAAASIPRGIGFGPAEVDFLHVFATPSPRHYDDAAAVAVYNNLLRARYASTNVHPGPDGTLGNADDIYDSGLTAAPGFPATPDTLSIVKHHGVPNSYGALVPPYLSWYASPPDVWGRGAIVLDYGGQPLTTGMGMAGEMTDQPYELSLSGQENNTDSPYTLVELERMLRYNDQDVQNIVSRPLMIAGSSLAASPPGAVGADEALRNLFTTHSSHIPSPAHAIPVDSRGIVSEAAGVATVLDVYAAKLDAGLAAAGWVNPARTNEVLRQMRKIAPWEFFHGRKFDINRWLGDGWDSSGTADGVADDWFEAGTGENAWQAPASFTGVAAQHSNGMDVNSDGAIDGTDRALARQLYARHLYCLAMAMIPSGFDPQVPNEPMAIGNRRELFARRIAQWAINCVDFRDSDSIMTAFEYDIAPFDGWHVDGNPATDNTDNSNPGTVEQIDGGPINPPTATNQRRLVWGLEYPDLLITETYAFHDRRVKDTNQDSPSQDRNDTPMNDNDVDQFRVPQGSLFIELYCPRNRVNRNPRLPFELYDYSVPANPRLQIGRLAPDGRPVWRLAISRIIGAGETGQQAVHPATLATTNPESASYDPFAVNLLPGGTPATPVAIDRFAYFGDATGIPAAELARSFYSSSNANPLVEPGQYVVVGPRLTTYLGSQDPNDPATAPAPMPAGTLWGGNSRQSVVLNAGGITITDADGNNASLTPGTDIRPAVPVVCDMPGVTPVVGGATPAPWTQACPWNIGLNISEPLPAIPGANYYPQPRLTVTPPGATQPDFYADPADPTADPLYLFRDQPVETPGVPANAGRPIADRGMTESGPYDNCSSVFLQRLANPNLPFNAATNPYISVDWATIDLNVFSGEEDSDRTVMGGMDDGDPIDPDDDPGSQPNGGVPFGTRERGYRPAPPAAGSNYWNPVVGTTPGDFPPAATPQGAYFRFNLARFGVDGLTRQTFGYVNGPVGTPIGPAPNVNLGEPSLTAGGPDGPGQTVPWLAFHNRPFSNPMELLLVPSSSPGRLCSELTPGPLNASLSPSPYDAAGDPQSLRSPVGHLLNLFHTADQSASPNAASQLGRLLDYVEVPSPYQGAERWFTPAHFTAPVLPTNPLATYRPPFNKASRFRDPGRININTIFDERILWAAFGMPPSTVGDTPLQDRSSIGWNTLAFANKVFMSRQGYGTSPPLTMNPAYPTRFANPIRSADASDMMPDLPAGPGSMSKDRPIDATLLRPAPDAGNAALFDDEPLFAALSTGGNSGHNNTERNPYFRYQGYQKIGSVFSTTSNVFAVWMTIGYFEVEDNLDGTGAKIVDAAHPEGLRLGQEIGADSGEITRHRSFYILDRSIPVGYIPGQKHNTDDCILLRRQIE